MLISSDVNKATRFNAKVKAMHRKVARSRPRVVRPTPMTGFKAKIVCFKA